MQRLFFVMVSILGIHISDDARSYCATAILL
jgi:hypothetical protein